MKQKFWELPFDCHLWRESDSHLSMSLPAIGLYLELIVYQWIKGAIPNDMTMIVAIVGKPAAQVRRAWKEVKQQFPESEDGKLRNVKLEEIREAKSKASERQREYGRQGGLAKARRSVGGLEDYSSQRVGSLGKGYKGAVRSELEGASTNSSSVVRNSVLDLKDLDQELDQDQEHNPGPTITSKKEEFKNQAAFDEFRDAYPKETLLFGPLLTDAWYDIVETAVNPEAIWSLVKAGLARMKASGTGEEFMPAAAKFLREKEFMRTWKPRRTDADEAVALMDKHAKH